MLNEESISLINLSFVVVCCSLSLSNLISISVVVVDYKIWAYSLLEDEQGLS